MGQASIDAAVAARLASSVRSATRRRLTLDTSVRSIVLGPGGWRLYGVATASWYATRDAADSAGTLATGESAPTTSDLAAPSAGSPGAGLAWPASGTSPTGLQLPLSSEDYREIAVRGGKYVVLYVRSTSGVTADLEGPFEDLA